MPKYYFTGSKLIQDMRAIKVSQQILKDSIVIHYSKFNVFYNMKALNLNVSKRLKDNEKYTN